MDINTEKYTNIEASRSWARYMAKDQGLKPWSGFGSVAQADSWCVASSRQQL